MSEELEFEPIPGLPSELPPGERLLWQGRPSWRSLARHAFEVRWLAAYFAVFTVLRGLAQLREGRAPLEALVATVVVVPAAALCLGLFTLLAVLHARATVYSITSKRVVMRFGIAFPMTFNLPFRRLGSADLSVRPEGDGDIALRLSGPDRIAWLHLWPHARPWHFSRAQPLLRGVPEAAKVASLLAGAVQAWLAEGNQAVRGEPRDDAAGRPPLLAPLPAEAASRS